MLISLCGYQSLGKSTAVYEMAHYMKVKGNVSVGIWTDLPRHCPLSINEDGRSNTQFWIAGKMITTTLELLQIHDVVITDRTPYDCVVYELAVSQDKDLSAPMVKALYQLTKEFYAYNSGQIIYCSGGYEHKLEAYRSDNTAFNEKSLYWFNQVYDQVDKIQVDLKNWDMRSYLDEQIRKISKGK
jgi:hypothetical protein